MSTRRVVDLTGPGWFFWRDEEATWEHDALYLPPVDISTLPQRPPSCGWTALDQVGRRTPVPSTVEAHDWDEIGDYRGVSWWWRPLEVPAEAQGRRVVLQFEAVRLRAEVFLDQDLVGYDLIGNTPFEVDITDYVRPGRTHRLAVRVTDPCGNFSWEDFQADRWGAYTLPASHGFGGITGPVRLLVHDPVHVADVFIRNQPVATSVELSITVRNATPQTVTHALHVRITDARDPSRTVYEHVLPPQRWSPGEHTVEHAVSVPSAQLWCPERPHLYVCTVSLDDNDTWQGRFGFRWFTVTEPGRRPMFRLNGRRVVLRTAISWGFWPGNGVWPGEELARRQITLARALGLNMLSFHRNIGQPLLLNLADELGLMFYEEPGGYTAHGGDAFCQAWAREKLLRMVTRDRNHPSLVIYNMINEEEGNPTAEQRADMADAHRLDPTRCITFTSGWNKPGEDPRKLHMLPLDNRQYIRGWTDFHHATGPGVYRDEFYRGPRDYRLCTDNTEEIVFWGEEGAIGTPPRLELIYRDLQGQPNGWDGADYRAWYQAYADYLRDKQLTEWFPSVDALTQTIGDISFYYQGRIIENARLGNLTDGYAINGWEAQKWENHSGVVDCFRNPKGHPALLQYYNQPVYVAVKLRQKIAHTPANVVADFYIVNETDLQGEFTLSAWLEDGRGQRLWLQDFPVSVTGGDVHGELLAEHVEVRAAAPPGEYELRAELRDARRKVCASGRDELLLVDWRKTELPPDGALLESGDTLRRFVGELKGDPPADYAPAVGPLRWVLIGDCNPRPRTRIPAECLRTTDEQPGLRATYYSDTALSANPETRVDAQPYLTGEKDADGGVFVPDRQDGSQDFSVRWEGGLVAPESGAYQFHADSDDGIRIWVDDQLVVDAWDDYAWWHEKRPRLVHGASIELAAGQRCSLRIEHWRAGAQGHCEVLWTTPSARAAADVLVLDLLRRVQDDGTTVVALEHAREWAEALRDADAAAYRGWMHGKRHWLGSNFFVRSHPLFDELPVNHGMNWQYQEFAEYGARRYGLLLDGEEAVVGFVGDHMHQVGTAVGVLRHGRGRIVLSTLEVLPRLHEARSPCDVVRKYVCNAITYASRPMEPA